MTKTEFVINVLSFVVCLSVLNQFVNCKSFDDSSDVDKFKHLLAGPLSAKSIESKPIDVVSTQNDDKFLSKIYSFNETSTANEVNGFNSDVANDYFALSKRNTIKSEDSQTHDDKFFMAPDVNAISLVIVFDSTGSMRPYLDQLIQAAKKIVEKFANSENYAIYNYILVPYNDPMPIEPYKLVTLNFTEMLNALNDLEIGGGGDCAETPLSGIKLALKYALPKSNVYIFSDATAKDYKLEDDVIDAIQMKQIVVNESIYNEKKKET